jgi:hypothetical protein
MLYMGQVYITLISQLNDQSIFYLLDRGTISLLTQDAVL